MHCPLIILSVILVVVSCKEIRDDDRSLQSPDGKIKITVGSSDKGGVNYSIQYGKNVVLDKSDLGLLLQSEDLFKSLTLKSISGIADIKDEYSLLHGKRKNNIYHANQKTFHCENASGKKLDIIFNISNDGVAFHYYLPDSSSSITKIIDEKTAFQFPAQTKAWLQPMSDAKTGWNKSNPSYEEYYEINIPVGKSSPTSAGWVFPGLFKVDSIFVLITESGLQRNYCGSRFEQASPNGRYEIGFPQKEETIFGGPIYPESTTPWHMPWRIIAVGDLGNIVESTLGTDVAAPAVSIDQSFIKPGLASWSWALLKDESIVYDVQKKFVDYAADMKWPYCLVDVNWDTNIGYSRIAELSKYAQSKNVGLILWYNSAGDWNTTPYHPRDKMLTHESRDKEFGILQQMKIAGVKIDFFGGDGQSVIQYYQDILKDAAEHNLMVNFHGATLPRGWQRTYPNLVTMESIKGFEFITFEQQNADHELTHCALIPFIRNAFDPMDFTPMNLSSIPKIERRTTAAFELALPTLFLSGVQHIAETPEGMSHVPDYVKNYLTEIPTDWDDTKFVAGFPGEYAVIARRKGDRWYVTGINSKNDNLNLTLNLSFINANDGMLITDGKETSFERTAIHRTNKSPVVLSVIPHGGFVMQFE